MTATARRLDEEELRGGWAACQDGIRPDTPETVSQWADAHRMLSPKGAAEPGKWETSRTPYLKEIMDVMSAMMPIVLAVVKKGSQVGVSEAGNNVVGEAIDRRRIPIGILLPDLDTAGRKFVKQKLDPMFEDTPRLSVLVRSRRERDGGNSTFLKDFPGGLLMIMSAKSAAGLRAVIMGLLFADEVDAYDETVGNEGDTLTLAKRGLRSYGDRQKTLEVSTPLLDGSSRISDDYDACDVRLNLFVPCPFCEAMQILEHENLVWPEGHPDAAQFRCVACEALIPEQHKTWMLARYEWRIIETEDDADDDDPDVERAPRPVGVDGASATSPYVLAALERAGISPVLLEAVRRGAKSVGFHLPAYYSPHGWFSWAQCAELYEEGKVDPDKLQVYDNTVRGIAHKKATDSPDYEHLYERREVYPFGIVPSPRALFLTAGVDVQKNRLEWEIVAWGRGKESWSVDYGVIDGSIVERRVTHALDEVLMRDVPCADGAPLPIRVLGLDTGHDTENLYTWARRHIQPAYGAAGASCQAPHTVAVMKGKDTGPRLAWSTSRDDLGGKRRGLRIYQVSSFHFASELYSWLRLHAPTDEDVAEGVVSQPGYCHFPQYNLEYFKQLTADRCQITMVRGYARERYALPKGLRNEAHDCRKYARAAAELFGLSRFNDHHWRALEVERGMVHPEEQPALPLHAKYPPRREELPERPAPASPAPAPASVAAVEPPTLVDASTGWEIAFRTGGFR